MSKPPEKLITRCGYTTNEKEQAKNTTIVICGDY